MSELEIITATEASRAFSEMLHRVCYGGESFVIKKGNRLMARLLPVEAMETEKAQAPEAALPEPVPAGVTYEENEFYHAWMEQVRKVDA